MNAILLNVLSVKSGITELHHWAAQDAPPQWADAAGAVTVQHAKNVWAHTLSMVPINANNVTRRYSVAKTALTHQYASHALPTSSWTPQQAPASHVLTLLDACYAIINPPVCYVSKSITWNLHNVCYAIRPLKAVSVVSPVQSVCSVRVGMCSMGSLISVWLTQLRLKRRCRDLN